MSSIFESRISSQHLPVNDPFSRRTHFSLSGPVSPWRVMAVLVAFLLPYVPLAFKVIGEIGRHDPLAEPHMLTARVVVVAIFSIALSCNVARWMDGLTPKRRHGTDRHPRP